MKWTTEAMERDRVVRFDDLQPCRHAFIDTRTPGSEGKENFTIIGPGVAENPAQYVHIPIPHGFNIGGARQPTNTVNSPHSHETPEVFIVHRGRWAFRWGERGEDGEAILEPGDTISIPLHVFRGFENVGPSDGFLFAILGGDDPGRVTWAPHVIEAAAEHGLVLLKDGRLIDRSAGESVPDDATPVRPISADAVARYRRMSAEEMRTCIQSHESLVSTTGSVIQERGTGVAEAPIIGEASAAEGLPAGCLAWPHGFHLRWWLFEPGARIPPYIRDGEEVLLMQAGCLRMSWPGGGIDLCEGDVATVPIGLPRSFEAAAGCSVEVFVVRGGDPTAAPRWQ